MHGRTPVKLTKCGREARLTLAEEKPVGPLAAKTWTPHETLVRATHRTGGNTLRVPLATDVERKSLIFANAGDEPRKLYQAVHRT